MYLWVPVIHRLVRRNVPIVPILLLDWRHQLRANEGARSCDNFVRRRSD